MFTLKLYSLKSLQRGKKSLLDHGDAFTTLLILMTVFFVLFIYYHGFNLAEAKLSVDLKVNPDRVDNGEKSVFTVFVKNEGNATTNMTRLILLSPWQTQQQLNHSIILNPNSIYVKSIDEIIPENTRPGNYDIAVLVKTNNSDSVAHSPLATSTIEGVSLSGQIPFSIMAIILPGILTYFIIIYLLTRKFDRSYIEVGLVSVGFGFFAWILLHKITNRSFYTILQISTHSVFDYVIVFGIASLIGLVSVFLVQIVRRLNSWLMEYKTIKNFNDALLIEGYAETRDPTWISFIKEQLDVSKKFGIEYTVRLRIYSKTAPSSLLGHSYNGLLRQFENDPPYHVYLRPKYFANCTKQKLLDILADEQTSPLKKSLEANQQLCLRASKFVGEQQCANPQLIFDKAKQRLQSANDLESFANVLNSLDFSAYVQDVLKYLENEEKVPVRKVYDDFSFIIYDQIRKIEVVSYETPYSLTVDEKGQFTEIPGTREFTPGIVVNE
jgi:hypothetical protein